MKRTTLSLILALTVLVTSILGAQNQVSAPQTPEIEVTHAQYLGTTPPLRHLVPLSSTTAERRENAEDRKRTVPNFVGRRPTEVMNADALPKGADPVRQLSFNHSAQTPVEPIVNIDGLHQGNANGVNPPDPCGDIGKDHYIQMVNATLFRIFDKEGNPASGIISANTIWSQVGFSSAGDPIILYDQEAERWIITEFPPNNFLLVAISEDNDPLGSWSAYAFSTPSFPDYPKYSLWNNAYCVTTNEGGSGLKAYFIDRQAILSGAATPAIVRITVPEPASGPGFFVATPVDWTGATPPPVDAKPMLLRLSDDAWGGIPADAIEVYEVDVDFATPANTSFTTTTVPTAPFNTDACAAPGAGFACIPQLGGGGIDGIPEIIMHQAHYRNFGSHESMVLNFLVNADGSPIRAGIRWMELRRTSGNSWTVYQEGTFAPADNIHRFMGGICMDGSGNIGLAYSISSPQTQPGLAFTGRKASDPLGEMTVPEYVIVEGMSASGGSRYGDYAQLTVDPANDNTFWYTGEYRRPSNWGTKIFSFQFSRDTNDIGPAALLSPLSSPNLTAAEPVKILVKNFGIDTQSVFDVGYIFENGAPVVESVNFTLAPDSFYMHTFIPTVDMALVGDYEFKVFTNLPDGDDAPLNDTLRLVRSKLPRFDAGISDIGGLDGLSCAAELEAQVVLTNFGTEPLTSVTIVVTLNAALFETINWTGVLEPGASINLPVTLTGFLNGANEISATTSDPNGEVDEVMVNDTFTRPFNALLNGETVTLQLLTDNWPEETTWELKDENDNLLFSGGPYGEQMTLYEEEFCLDPEACYEFTIFDSYGDGICCGFGLGNYSIVDMNGNTLASSTGEFGTSETLNFCATFECMMTADIDTSPESADGAADGVIMIVQQNGVGPFMYSIDGGITFQSSNVFDGLSAGEYEVVVTGEFGCEYTESVNVGLCALAIDVEATPESNSNSNDGSIVITATGANGNLMYSINGGSSFQSNGTFNNLGTGEYDVVVRDELGCTAGVENVLVDIETAAKDHYRSQTVEVFPNPTLGVFRINVKGLETGRPLLPVEMYDANGKLVQVSTLGKYNGVFTGQMSLVAHPAGVYYVRFLDENMNRMVRIVKE